MLILYFGQCVVFFSLLSVKNSTPENNNNWLKVKLEGTVSNRQGIGSFIEISINGEKQYRYTHCGEGYLSQNSGTEIFGVGQNTVLDYVKVKWLSGIEDILYNVPINQTLNIVEGSTLSLTDYQIEPKVFYNNPVKETLILNSSVAIDNYVLIDTCGNVILKENVNSSNFNLNFNNLAIGVYFCQLNFKNSLNKTLKLIKQ